MRQFNERIIVSNKQIQSSKLSYYISQVKKAAAAAHVSPTYFEFTTAIAFLHFAHQDIDLAVIEVGMGGKLDATNTINPILTIITNIDLDHTKWLGSTKKDIASRKAGIIKPHTPLVTAETDSEILSFFKKTCVSKQAPCHQLQKEIAAKNTTKSLTKQTFTTTGIISNTFTITLLGDHQIENAATALYAMHLLQQAHPQLIKLTQSQIKQGLATTKWEGRSDIFSHNPFIMLDGAHNEAGLTALSKTLDSYPFPQPEVLIIGLKNDKNPKPLFNKIIPRFRHIIITESNHQPFPANKLADYIKTNFPDPKHQVKIVPDPKQAIITGKKFLQPKKMLLITGSLYLIGDCLSILRQ